VLVVEIAREEVPVYSWAHLRHGRGDCLTLKGSFVVGVVEQFGSATGTHWWQVQRLCSVCGISSWRTASARRVSQRPSSTLRHNHWYGYFRWLSTCFQKHCCFCELFDFVRILMHLVSYCGIWLKCASKHGVVWKMVHGEALAFTAQIEKSSIVCGWTVYHQYLQ